MIAALALAAVLAAPPTTPAQADPPPLVQSPQDKMEALQQVYDESCGSRGYGEYDDVCNSIRDEIRQAERELKKQVSGRKPPVAPPAAQPDAPPSQAAAPTGVASSAAPR